MSASLADERNADQIAYWNGPGGRHWTERQEIQDAVLAPVSDALFERADIRAGERVIDIGCGCGATTFDIAKRAGANGFVTGIDVSSPMLAKARELTPAGSSIDFVQADATTHAFAPMTTDLLFSRFGVMFFSDPTASFTNLRKSLKANGRLAFACWRTPRDNPWLMLALTEAYKHVPKMPEVKPEDPGPFAFASEDRVRDILGKAGFASIGLERVDLSLDIATGRGLDAAVESALAIGPASRALEGQPSEKVASATQSIREALAKHLKGNSVPLGGSIWIVTAKNPA